MRALPKMPHPAPTATVCGLTDWVKVAPTPAGLTIQLYRRQGGPVALHALLPLVQSSGLLVERETAVPCSDVASATVQTLHASVPNMFAPPTPAMCTELEALLSHGLAGRVAVDEFNRLILSAGLTVLEVACVRAYAAWACQLNSAFSLPQLAALLAAPTAAPAVQAWLAVFQAKFNPVWDAAELGPRSSAVHAGLQVLKNTAAAAPLAVDETAWRTLTELLQHTTRTNFFALPGLHEALAFKLASHACPVVPQPGPWVEIWVHHPSVVGVHLRGGPVARGGIRFSDRPTDFRTEVLGLMLTQMRKNSIILPVGAKGGFVAMQPVADRAELEHLYRRYIRALLSLTDTRDGSKIVPPMGVLAHDGPDPYLVVAADKGTATFSDAANAEAAAAAYWGLKTAGFWLHDAFASGGSAGYDHKELGITARGAWLSVLHHLNALGIVPSAKRPITLVGIGDMGGDVFGNGLLQSPHVQLVAAFNHAHIFIDPTPNPATSFAERQRCFAAKLGWGGYDVKKLSAGGGIYPRSAKSIVLSAAAQKALGVKKSTFTPEALIQAILAAPVDVLWNGGIGTYIKASTESHADVRDKANDEERISAGRVRAKVVGEGGNLGLTPAARVELALAGVRLNTDAVDNAGGVNCSDLEVNIKLALAPVVASGKLQAAARVKMLKTITPDVVARVLANSRLQNLALSTEEAAGPAAHAELAGWQTTLAKRGVLHASHDPLPTAAELHNRKPALYTRPELAVLLSATRQTLKTQLQSDAAADIRALPLADALVAGYFPPAVQKLRTQHGAPFTLEDDLKAALLASLLAGRLGLGFGATMATDFGVQPLDIVRAAAVAIHVLDLTVVWAALDAAEAPVATQVAALARTRTVAAGLAAWVLRHGSPVRSAALLAELTPALAQLRKDLPKLLVGPSKTEFVSRAQAWQARGVPAAAAAHVAGLSSLSIAPDAVRVAARTGKPVASVFSLHVQVGEVLGIPTLVRRSRELPCADRWTRMAVQACVQEFGIRQRGITTQLLRRGGAKPLAAWQTSHAAALARYHGFVENILAEKTLSVAMLNVLTARLRELEG